MLLIHRFYLFYDKLEHLVLLLIFLLVFTLYHSFPSIFIILPFTNIAQEISIGSEVIRLHVALCFISESFYYKLDSIDPYVSVHCLYHFFRQQCIPKCLELQLIARSLVYSFRNNRNMDLLSVWCPISAFFMNRISSSSMFLI